MHNFDGVCIAVLPFKAEAPLIVDTDCGERGRNRTYNLVIKSHLLCQLSYAPGLVWRILALAQPRHNAIISQCNLISDNATSFSSAGWRRQGGRDLGDVEQARTTGLGCVIAHQPQ
jgi:hypothetical protein